MHLGIDMVEIARIEKALAGPGFRDPSIGRRRLNIVSLERKINSSPMQVCMLPRRHLLRP